MIFWEFLHLSKAEIYKISKIQSLLSGKHNNFRTSRSSKWFHVKYEWQKNPVTFTLCMLNLIFQEKKGRLLKFFFFNFHPWNSRIIHQIGRRKILLRKLKISSKTLPYISKNKSFKLIGIWYFSKLWLIAPLVYLLSISF